MKVVSIAILLFLSSASVNAQDMSTQEAALKGLPDRIPALKLRSTHRDGAEIRTYFVSQSSTLPVPGTEGSIKLGLRVPNVVVTVYTAETEDAAELQKRKYRNGTQAAGFETERNGLSLTFWGRDEPKNTYRILTRVGTDVVDIETPPSLTGLALPILDYLVEKIRIGAM